MSRSAFYDTQRELSGGTAVFGAVLGGAYETALRFGDPEEEWAATAKPGGAGLIDRGWLSVLSLRGRDRLSFLQGMVSNDVASLAPGQGCHAALLDTTGHILADLGVHALVDRVLIETDLRCIERLAQTLDRFLIMEKVEIEDVSDVWTILRLQGERAPSIISQTLSMQIAMDFAPSTHTAITLPSGESALVIPVAENTFDLWLPAAQATALWRAFVQAGATPVGWVAADILRVEAGTPQWGAELTEQVLLPETGMVDAVSYTKGCYVGQEIIARLHARGHTNRELRALAFDGDALPEPGDTLYAPDGTKDAGREIGRLTSVVRSPRALGRGLALGYVRSGHLEPGSALEAGAARVHGRIALPWQ